MVVRHVAGFAAALGASLILSGAASAQTSPDVPDVYAPAAPPPEVEAPPPPPASVDVWTPGHWAWNGANWDWVPGQYVQRPAPQAAWVPGHWEASNGGYVWVSGHWEG